MIQKAIVIAQKGSKIIFATGPNKYTMLEQWEISEGHIKIKRK
jgi:hypothetical protein